MATIEIDTERLDIVVQSEFHEKELVKLIPGTRWDKTMRTWRAPLSWGTCIAFRGVFKDDLLIGPNLTDWAWTQRNEWVDPAMSLRLTLEEPALMQDEPNLYPFQRSGVQFLTLVRQALIADEMGSGKTVQLIRAIDRMEAYPALVICPNTMKYTWQREYEVWAPEVETIVIDGGMVGRRKQLKLVEDGEFKVAIINWEALRLHTRLAPFGSIRLTDKEKETKELNVIPWATVVADEAHRAKNPNSKQTRALWAMSRDAEVRFAATGTPIANQPAELWSIMNFVAPLDFAAKSKFIDRYCMLSWNTFGGMDIVGIKPEMREEFSAILDPRMIRRLKSVVLPHLPPKVYVQRDAPMTTKQKKAYKQMTDQMLAELAGGDVIAATNPLVRMTRLSQFASAYAELDDEGKLLLSNPSNKLDALMEILEEAEGEQVVVFAESRQLIELAATRLEKARITFGEIHGKVTPEVRQLNIDLFQRGDTRVMLATMGAGGEGITLTAARVAVFLQRSWSLVKNMQAEDRLHRPGQKGTVEIIDVVAPGTVEEYRTLKLKDKENMLQEVVRDADTVKEMLKWK